MPSTCVLSPPAPLPSASFACSEPMNPTSSSSSPATNAAAAVAAAASTSKSTSTSGRSRLISRLASPLASAAKPRNLSNFSIEPDEPRRQYSPGDTVRGNIHLTVHKPLRVTHIVISLHGIVKVYKNPTPPGQGIPSEVKTPAPGRGRRGAEYHGNGLLSLFEDEYVACGEGLLPAGRYSFAFEVQFPPSRLPSSLDFERGTISYILVSTLTRSTTIAPTVSCERKVYLREPIDIAYLHPPKPRIVSLTPQLKKSMSKKSLVIQPPPIQNPTAQARSASSRPESLQSENTAAQDDSPDSPVPSEFSVASAISNSSVSIRIPQSQPSDQDGGPAAEGSSNNTNSSTQRRRSGQSKTITAKVDLLHTGYLPGDLVHVRVHIKHTKVVRSLRGVVVTLYRKGRILPYPFLAPDLKIGRHKEDFMPRSRTGLEGLSLSGASASHTFRMDLTQSMAPLVVNPANMEAEVKTFVQIPDESFPTISCVPGGMIVFTYHVEVIMDLNCKIPGQDSLAAPRMNMLGAPSALKLENGVANSQGIVHAYADTHNLVDTSFIRRDKSVAYTTFDVIVGSRNTQRSKTSKKPIDPWVSAAERSVDGDTLDGLRQAGRAAMAGAMDGLGPFQHSGSYNRPLETSGGQSHVQEDGGSSQALPPNLPPPLPPPAPLPVGRPPALEPPPLDVPRDEKARIQWEEQIFLPSVPPLDEASSSSSANGPAAAAAAAAYAAGSYAHPPSAPFLNEESGEVLPSSHNHNNHSGSLGIGLDTPATAPLPPPVPLPDVVETHSHNTTVAARQLALPITTGANSSSGPGPGPYLGTTVSMDRPQYHRTTDDKQELERRRLLENASAPEWGTADDHDNGGGGADDRHRPYSGGLPAEADPSRSAVAAGGSTATASTVVAAAAATGLMSDLLPHSRTPAPTAPVLDEDDEYNNPAGHAYEDGLEEHLPQYQK